MDKQEVLQELGKRGYKAKIQDGIIYINNNINNFKKIGKVMAEIGYKGSYGVRPEREAADE